ncbi:PI-PLC X domain-containing protein 2-like isoform X2 [Anticarsia gemmatalis]|uniref:PI-PLC X domain-containing protein 2-like isoform X2 n=1 Tax=Anticarsia gemmatalis TaxID=129554 RepID=UPI003F7716F5
MAASVYAVLALAVTALGATIAPTEKHVLEKSSCGRVWVTVHSPEIRLAHNQRLLDAVELNWDFNACSSVPRQIGLFDDRPTSWNNVLALFLVTSVEGHIITNISLGEGSLPGGWEAGVGGRGPHCLWPWVGAGDMQEIQSYNCLKIQPTWMEDNAAQINNLRIGDLAIAGTHNAGAWRFDTEISTLSRDSFVLCQDRSIWAQLVHGIRYFDFRIAYYDYYQHEDDRYWLNHNLIRVRPLVPLLREIRKFLDTTKEVVFLDAHHFPVGFYEASGAPLRHVHGGLLRIIQREFGPHLALARDFSTGAGTRGPTLQTLINADKRLLFSYVDNAIVNENNWLWPILPHLWANTNSPTHLFTYLDNAISNSPSPTARSPLFSAMAQTTPTVLDILFLRGSLRENADDVNRNVTTRLATMWRSQANIVSTDFFLGNDVIDLSILISVERASRL